MPPCCNSGRTNVSWCGRISTTLRTRIKLFGRLRSPFSPVDEVAEGEIHPSCLLIQPIRYLRHSHQKIKVQMHGIQSTLISPGVLLDQSWMNFCMEKTPTRSSMLRPRTAWCPLPSACGSTDSQAI